MSFSLERAVVGLGAGAAVAVQGLLEALWPSQAIRCALDKDFARAVTAAGVSGQPCDEWLADSFVDSSPAAPPVGESSPAPNTSGCDTAPGEIPPSPGAIPTDGDCFDDCVGYAQDSATPKRRRPSGSVPTSQRLTTYLHSVMHENGFDWGATADALLQEFRITQK